MKRFVWIVEWKLKGRWRILVLCRTRESARKFCKYPLNKAGLLKDKEIRIVKYIPDNESLVCALQKYILELEKEQT